MSFLIDWVITYILYPLAAILLGRIIFFALYIVIVEIISLLRLFPTQINELATTGRVKQVRTTKTYVKYWIYSVYIDYTYTARNNQEYEEKDKCVGSATKNLAHPNAEEEAEEIAEKYKEGTEIPIYYHADKPYLSRMYDPKKKYQSIGATLTAIFLVGAIIIPASLCPFIILFSLVYEAVKVSTMIAVGVAACMASIYHRRISVQKSSRERESYLYKTHPDIFAFEESNIFYSFNIFMSIFFMVLSLFFFILAFII